MNAIDAALTGPPSERRLAWLLGPMRRHKGTYSKVAVAAALINLFGLATALFSMLVYDRVVPNNAQSSLVALSIGLAIIVIFDVALRMLRAYFVDLAGAGIDDDVGTRFFERLLLLRLELGRASTGALAGLARELETLRDFFASATLTAIVDVPFILITLLVVALIGGPVVWVPLVAIPLVLLIGWATQPALERWGARALGDGLLKQTVLVETVGGLETVKATGAGALLAQRWRQAMAGQNDSSLHQRLIATIGITAATTAATLSYAGVVVVGVAQIAKGELTIGGLIACSVLAGRAIAPLTQISQLLTRLSATRAALNQLDTLMRRPPEGPAGEPLRPGRIAGAVEFRNVSFTYPGAPEPALRDVSFKVAAGERVALLGRVGSGKSTVLRLAMALYPPSEGLVMLDGIDLRQFDPASLRARIGAALQDSVLWSGSVRDNVTLGRGDVDDAEMIRAASLSGTHDFMGALANGYELKLADRGEGLSGGQRQSIAIARALAGRPPVLLFDEPTSAMDAGTEAALLERLSAELGGRTLLLVTHRPPLLQLVSRVILLDRGRVIADGPRDEVMQRIGRTKVAAA